MSLSTTANMLRLQFNNLMYPGRQQCLGLILTDGLLVLVRVKLKFMKYPIEREEGPREVIMLKDGINSLFQKITRNSPGAVKSLVLAIEAMTSDRPYRRALSLEEAVKELKKGKGSQFDLVVVDIIEELKENGNLKGVYSSAKVSKRKH